jgi:hypothetical protein
VDAATLGVIARQLHRARNTRQSRATQRKKSQSGVADLGFPA